MSHVFFWWVSNFFQTISMRRAYAVKFSHLEKKSCFQHLFSEHYTFFCAATPSVSSWKTLNFSENVLFSYSFSALKNATWTQALRHHFSLKINNNFSCSVFIASLSSWQKSQENHKITWEKRPWWKRRYYQISTGRHISNVARVISLNPILYLWKKLGSPAKIK